MDRFPYGRDSGLVYKRLSHPGEWCAKIEAGDEFRIATVQQGCAVFKCPELAKQPIVVREGGIIGTTGPLCQFWSSERSGHTAAAITPVPLGDADRNDGVSGTRLILGTLPMKANPSLHAFPRFFYIPPEESETVACLQVLFSLVEREAQAHGDEVLRDDLVRRTSEILLIVLARHVGWEPSENANAGSGAIDPKLLRAIKLIETEAARDWTVGSLANEVGMGRSSFAVRFRQLVGDTPVNCLFKTRMRFASDLICAQGSSIAVVAEAIGYQSESAFSKAFVRHFGMTPGQYRAVANDAGFASSSRDESRAHGSGWRSGARTSGFALQEVDAR